MSDFPWLSVMLAVLSGAALVLLALLAVNWS